MFRFTVGKIAILAAAATSIAGVGALGVTHLGSAAPAAAQVSPAPSAPSPAGTTTTQHKDTHILDRALYRRLVTATADATGQTRLQVVNERKAGKSLSQIAGAKVAAIETTVIDAVKVRLGKALATGRITSGQAQDIISKLQAAIDKEMVATHTKVVAPAATPSL
ncbi:MAG TPA: hypothetical protein VI316_00125 [Candidatus Dormibacteraeota bacterium]